MRPIPCNCPAAAAINPPASANSRRVLARCALAAGADGLFIETHPQPDRALSDGPNMIPLAEMAATLRGLLKFSRLSANENEDRGWKIKDGTCVSSAILDLPSSILKRCPLNMTNETTASLKLRMSRDQAAPLRRGRAC